MTWRIAAVLLLLGGCTAYGDTPIPTEPGPPCPITGSRDWTAWVNAMPGPNAPRLIVTGKVTVPTGGYRVSLERGEVHELDPPIQQIMLEAAPPTGGAIQVVTEQEVRGEFPALDRYGAVIVRCGRDVIATISDIQRAY